LVCHGIDLRKTGIPELSQKPGLKLEWIIDAYRKMNMSNKFFIGYFDTLAGTNMLRAQIGQGKTPEEIRSTWKPGLIKYRAMRKKYLLYPD